MPYDLATGIFTPPSGAENAFAGKLIESATWNAIFTDIASALTQVGQSSLSIPTIVTGAGPFTISADESLFVMNKGSPSASAIALPAVALREGRPLVIKDWRGNAGDITITPNGSETIEGLSSWLLSSGGSPGTGGSIKLLPSTDLSGWLVLI